MTKDAQHPPTLAHTPGPWDYDMDFIVAPDPNGAHRDIYFAEIAHADDDPRLAEQGSKGSLRDVVANCAERIASVLEGDPRREVAFFPAGAQELVSPEN